MKRLVTEEGLREQQRRIDATIARASARNMSNAKWRKLFATFCEQKISPIRFKFLRDERVAIGGLQLRAGEAALGDELPAPCMPYREIEWVEVPVEHAEVAEAALAEVGRFPLVRTETGLRVVAYEW